MGCAIVADTNVFLLADSDANCADLSNRLMYSWDYSLVLDRAGEIQEEYKMSAKQHPESPLRRLVSLLVERETSEQISLSQTQPFIIPLPNGLTKEEEDLLRDHSCHLTAERAMIGVAVRQPGVSWLIPGANLVNQEYLHRGYRHPGKLESLLGQLEGNIHVVTTDRPGHLFRPGDPVPTTQEELAAFLEQNRLDSSCVERQFLECKCPDNMARGADRFLAEGIAEAICALSNTTSGFVFVGVKDNGEIIGVPRRYGDKDKDSWDQVCRDLLSARLDHYSPRKPLVQVWFISVQSTTNVDRKVIAMRVEKQRSGEFRYRGRVFIREGTMSVDRDAVASR